MTNQSYQWDENSYFWIELGAAAQFDELSLKLYGGGDGPTQSFKIPAGAKEYEVVGSDVLQDIVVDCDKVTLMYRKSDVPRVVYLCSTEYETARNVDSNILPSPLHDDHAIVTEL